MSELRTATRLDPANPAEFTALGAALRRTGDLAGSREALDRGRELTAASDRHSQAVLHTNKGIESLKQGDLPAATQALTLAVAAEPDFADANHYLGIALSATGKLTELSEVFRKTISAQPSDPEIHFNYSI